MSVFGGTLSASFRKNQGSHRCAPTVYGTAHRRAVELCADYRAAFMLNCYRSCMPYVAAPQRIGPCDPSAERRTSPIWNRHQNQPSRQQPFENLNRPPTRQLIYCNHGIGLRTKKIHAQQRRYQLLRSARALIQPARFQTGGDKIIYQLIDQSPSA